MSGTFEIKKVEEGRYSIYDWGAYPDDCIPYMSKEEAQEIVDKLSKLLKEEN
ncbi:hypothetical protein [Bacillus cereus]|uniref:hypothetical protein n=1 Tax=Bacillus cereus TaxID=1396 RepID=UPI0018F6F4C8|nr:hypothetical protein [Bacillus cereus]MBJ8023730.1 hypothetical protein [Bacillus cereus]